MHFLKDNKRFSLKIDNTSIWDKKCDIHSSENGNTLTTVYDINGLRITNIAKKHEKFGAYEWVNYIENTSNEQSGIISDLWDCDCELEMEHEDDKKSRAYAPNRDEATKIYAPSGSTWQALEFYCDVDKIVENERINHIYPGKKKEFSASGGRSSEKQAPFFDISKNDCGYIFAIGWSGQWKCEIERTNNSVKIRSKIEDTNFKLYPGEKIRTSSVLIMPYCDGTVNAHNKWRRLIKEDISQVKGELPLSAEIWGGMRTSSVLGRIEKIKKNELPFDCLWIDAGWYGSDTKPSPDEFEGDWSRHTGDWEVSPLCHPNGLTDVSKVSHDASMKFLLWAEPERVVSCAEILKEHPEYFLRTHSTSWNCLLNLGNETAWNYCFDTLCGLIEKLDVDIYRQDFNFSPLSTWRANDAEDRQGICEIKHINGMYKLWDTLLSRFPNLMIDNCASGGRRIDIETLRRSVPLWRSDAQCAANCDPEILQCHTQTFNLWTPYTGTSSGRMYDEYCIRSAYSSAVAMSYPFSERDSFCESPEKTAFLKKYMKEYLKTRPYFSEDFYSLTEASASVDIWCATQLDRPDKDDGMIEIFRREKSPYETARFDLYAIDKDAKYLFTDADGGEFSISGTDLSKNGFCVTISEKRKAKIFFYKKIL